MTHQQHHSDEGPSLWRALDAPAPPKHHATQTAHQTPSHTANGHPIRGEGYTYHVHPWPPERPAWLVCVGCWAVTVVPVHAILATIALAAPAVDLITGLAVGLVLHAVACIALTAVRS